ncbi:metal ABC transporter permease [Brevibacterium gallinarum]|uniref:Metal ABC transporter permease n=1 Tax=Brevibacterium gallinarum TaxID=2762220 RepID=A0ABR8WQT4_9MICO|nr:metal ABC transporter permease [Brevibacterium gallinarum]MBD8019442.1 metal ABC transporter permease [Brevibacterium gallinarum]
MTLWSLLTEHSYRMVLFGTGIIGLGAGALGAFTYLRRQSLLADVVSHSSLLGIVGGFALAVTVFGIDGRSLPVLILGAGLVGLGASLLANAIARRSRVGIDAAMAIILALCFGAGMVLLRLIQKSSLPGKGGLGAYLFGSAATITRADLITTAIFSGGAIIVVLLLWKPFVAVTFDAAFARQLGYRVGLVDAVMFATMVIAIVVGIKAVGVILMVAFAIAPPAAARQWTRKVGPMVSLSGAFGALGAMTGTWISVSIGSVPTGPVIVLVLTALVFISLFFAPRRSLAARWRRARRGRAALQTAPAATPWEAGRS